MRDGIEAAVRAFTGAERKVNVDMHQNEMRRTPGRGMSGIGTEFLIAARSAFLKVWKLGETFSPGAM